MKEIAWPRRPFATASDTSQVHVVTLGVITTWGTKPRRQVWRCQASGTNGNTTSLESKKSGLRGPALTRKRAKRCASRFIRKCGSRSIHGGTYPRAPRYAQHATACEPDRRLAGKRGEQDRTRNPHRTNKNARLVSGHFFAKPDAWRRGWDSNPRYGITVHRISSPAHSTTLPPLQAFFLLWFAA